MPQSSRGPAYYAPAPFHIFRMISGLSCTIIAGVLLFFCMQLKNDGFKLPWTLLIVLATAILNLLTLILTVLISCCGSRSPLVNLFINLPVFLAWVVAYSLLTYNIYGTLAHSCSISVWAASEGVTVCNVYKTFYAFVIFASLSQLALLCLDVQARRKQVRMGTYDEMDSAADNKGLLAGSTAALSPAPADVQHDSPGWRPGTATDKKGPVAQSYELQPQTSNHEYHGDSVSSYPQSQYTYARSEHDSSYSDIGLRHGTPEYIGTEYSHGSQYQAHAYSDLHERGRGNQYSYGQSPQSPAYDARSYAYHNDRGY